MKIPATIESLLKVARPLDQGNTGLRDRVEQELVDLVNEASRYGYKQAIADLQEILREDDSLDALHKAAEGVRANKVSLKKLRERDLKWEQGWKKTKAELRKVRP